jgi:heterodisulfide reductase subunit A
VLRRQVEVKADLLCLSTAIEAERSNREVAATLGLELTQDGFFQEAESKWRPVDFLREGVFLAGTAHSPRPIAEVVAQAEAAAQRAFTYLSRQSVTTARVVSRVHDSLCSRCQTCVTICPYDARSYDPENDQIVVDQAACQGCGMCAVACPSSSAEVMGMSEAQTMAVIDAALQEIGG